MEPLELTQKQKDRLLKMCKELFPELDIFDIKSGMLLGTCGQSTDGISIHWFEFCMTRLVNKIFYPDGNGKRNTRKEVEYFFFQTFVDAVEGATSGYNHPIDFLYEKFKSQAKT